MVCAYSCHGDNTAIIAVVAALIGNSTQLAILETCQQSDIKSQ